MKKKIIKKIDEIEVELYFLIKKNNYISLFSGIGGLPLFYWLLYKATSKKKYLKKMDEVLHLIFNSINEVPFGISYCNGLTGVAFMLNYLLENGAVENYMNKNLYIFDYTISDFYLKNTNNSEDIDFLQGSFGAAHYLSRRIKKNPDVKAKAFKLFDKLIEIVEDNILKTGEVHTIMKFDEKTHRTNLGLAHGIISYIIVFCEIYSSYRNEKILSIIRKCVDCLLKFKSDEKKSLSLFPGIAINKNLASYNIPLGWCYGDQTISIGLYKASKILNDQSIKEEAFKLAYRNLSRDSIEKIFPLPMYDAGFCHGLSSIAYIHKKWYFVSKDKKFYSLYESFLSKTLDYGEKEIGIAGYRKYMGNNMYEDAIGLLDGVIGIGVVLIDYLLGENDTKWDQFFLLD